MKAVAITIKHPIIAIRSILKFFMNESAASLCSLKVLRHDQPKPTPRDQKVRLHLVLTCAR